MITSSRAKPSLKQRVRRSCRGGFTLVEMMFSAGILAIVVAIVAPTFIAFSKYTVSLGNYSEMSYDSRMVVEILARDIRGAESLTRANSARLTLELPADLGGNTVDYRYNADRGILYRAVTDNTTGTTSRDEMLEGLQRFQFVYYNRLGNESTAASRLTETKSINIDALMIREVVEQSNTDYIISAKFMLRNAN